MGGKSNKYKIILFIIIYHYFFYYLFLKEGHDNWVRGLLFHPNGKHLLSVSDDKTIKVWDLKQERCVRTLTDAHDHFITCISYNKKFPTLATGGVDDVIRIWNCR